MEETLLLLNQSGLILDDKRGKKIVLSQLNILFLK